MDLGGDWEGWEWWEWVVWDERKRWVVVGDRKWWWGDDDAMEAWWGERVGECVRMVWGLWLVRMRWNEVWGSTRIGMWEHVWAQLVVVRHHGRVFTESRRDVRRGVNTQGWHGWEDLVVGGHHGSEWWVWGLQWVSVVAPWVHRDDSEMTCVREWAHRDDMCVVTLCVRTVVWERVVAEVMGVSTRGNEWDELGGWVWVEYTGMTWEWVCVWVSEKTSHRSVNTGMTIRWLVCRSVSVGACEKTSHGSTRGNEWDDLCEWVSTQRWHVCVVTLHVRRRVWESERVRVRRQVIGVWTQG